MTGASSQNGAPPSPGLLWSRERHDHFWDRRTTSSSPAGRYRQAEAGSEQDQPSVRQRVVHVRKRACEVGGMLEHFEADNAIEATGRLVGVVGDERVVGTHPGKTRGTEQLSQSAIATPVIENAMGPDDCKQAAQKCSVCPGVCLWIVRINQQVFLVVDVPPKILLGEMVENRCEDELAHRAAVVIDG